MKQLSFYPYLPLFGTTRFYYLIYQITFAVIKGQTDYKMEIIKATSADIDELESLYNDLNDHFEATTNYPGWIKGIYPVRETALKGLEEGNLFVAKDGGIIAGSIILNHHPEEAYEEATWGIEADYTDVFVIHTLVVHPAYLNKGVGSLLMEFAKKHAVESGIKTIRLDVSENNLPAIRLYEEHGYTYVTTVDLRLGYEHLKWFRLYEMVL